MAIAFVNSSVISDTGSAPLGATTMSYTVGSNANEGLLIWIMTNQIAGNVVTAVTVGGNVATLVNAFYTGNQNIWSYCYEVEGPSSGSNIISITLSAGGDLRVGAHEFSGVNQSNMTAATSSVVGSSSPITLTVVTTQNNSWLACWARGNSSQPAASTGTTQRISNFNIDVGDSNGAKSPTGSYSMAWTNSDTMQGQIVEVVPASSGGSNLRFRRLLGVGI